MSKNAPANFNSPVARGEQSTLGSYQESRELSEIKGKMYLARQFPRDENWALSKVLQECERPEIATVAQYEYPKGDSVVRGPSIRLVEVLARHWGNIDYGVNEIETSEGETMIKTFAWDLETNVSDVKTFSVKHERSTKKGTYKLKDERDIYEMVANKGARRKRACLLSVMPGWYVDEAVKKCEDTLQNHLTDGKSMNEVIDSIVAAFGEFGIVSEQIQEKIGKDIDKLSKNDVVKLRHLYSAIKDGFVKPSDAFGNGKDGRDVNLPSEDEEKSLDDLNSTLMNAVQGEKDSEKTVGEKDGTDKR